MLSSRVEHFVESIIRDMTRLSLKHGASTWRRGSRISPHLGEYSNLIEKLTGGLYFFRG